MPKPKVDELILAIMKVKSLALKKYRLRTYHKLDDAEKEAGYELADIQTGKQKCGDKK